MYKSIQITLFTLLFCNVLNAQDWNEIYYLENEAQYAIEERDFDKAIDIYRRMVKEVPDNTYAKYMIGKLYMKTDDKKLLAIEYLEEASQNIALDYNEKSLREIRTPVDVLVYLGEIYQIANRIDEAVVVYNNFKDLTNSENEFYSIVEQRLKTCENAKLALANPVRVFNQNLGEPVNDEKSNFNPVFSGDGQQMVYTSYTRNYMDNYYVKKENGEWGSPKKISEKLSTKYYLKTASLSFDGKELYMVTDDAERNNIYVSKKEGNSWGEASKLPKPINEKKSNETHACISKDGKTLYFTSDRKDGLGGLDIYKSVKDAKGGWGDPVNLGPNVNTAFNEQTPFITMDDKYLFFSSEGHNSIGGYDIFYIDLDNGSAPVNLGYPANTEGDDVFFVPDNSLSKGWISRYDSTSAGENDIYYMSILPKIYFAGDVKNVNNNELIDDPELNISLIEAKTNEIKNIKPVNGKFEFDIKPGEYHVVINDNKYDTYTNKINIPNDYPDSKYLFEALLNPLNQPEEIMAEAPIEKEEVASIEEKPVEDIVVEESIKENIEPEPEKIVAEVVQEDTVKELAIKEDPVEVVPEKEIIKYVPKSSATVGEKTFSVQLMALKTPVEVDYFKDVDNVMLTKYPDGYYRYTVGLTSSYAEAQQIKENLQKIGYKDAFIRINEASPKFTIQIMALIIPVELSFFKNLTSVVVVKGADDYFRYTIGSFNSYEEAKEELVKLNEMGYNQAFVKKVLNTGVLAIN